MRANRSMPRAAVIPQLDYPDLNAAADWLVKAFGFTVRLRIGAHRIQMNVGDGAVVLTEPGRGTPRASIMVRVEDVDAHFERAKAAGARIHQPPESYPYGERQYAAEDPAGHIWTFSRSIADVEPESWGGTSERL